ncbi:dTDP-4-dehydrorhamnose 3,5-epimerase [Gammaproteobacteria bacterium]|nr:dTDP-4-dehydrorhamnose 3,5-epimerase [Gammaproteobacteria bacterium]
MKVISTSLQDCKIIKPKIFQDERGFFLETFQEEKYSEIFGPNISFVQDNFSRSTMGSLRGLHFQNLKPQGKLVRVSRGSVFDVAVDLRIKSPTFGRWEGFDLNEENMNQLWIPPGFAHGFLATSEIVDFEYKCTDYYDPNDEGCIHWRDPDLNITWPLNIQYIVSKKDENGSSFYSLFHQ